MSHSAEKVKGGTLSNLSTYILLQNIFQNEEGPFDAIKKFREKVSQLKKLIAPHKVFGISDLLTGSTKII